MTAPRYVTLDPDALATAVHVVVEAPTGIHYRHQYGGTACLQGQVEGFLVPVEGGPARPALRDFFERDLAGGGTGGHHWTAEELSRLRLIVAVITYWSAEEPHPLRLDETRLHTADEAWLPVLTPDGPAVLLWPNSD